jgi:hypothetical protein
MTRQEAIGRAGRRVKLARQKLRNRADEYAVIKARRDDPWYARGHYETLKYARELMHEAAEDLAKAYALFYEASIDDLDEYLEEKIQMLEAS